MSLPTNPLLGDAAAVSGGVDHTQARVFGPTTQLSEMTLGDLSGFLSTQQQTARSQLPIASKQNALTVDQLTSGSLVNLNGSGQVTVDGFVSQGVLQMDANGVPTIGLTLTGYTLSGGTVSSSTISGTTTVTGTVTVQGATLAGGTGVTLSGTWNFGAGASASRLVLPTWTTAQRPTAPANGTAGYNTDRAWPEVADASSNWQGLRPRVDERAVYEGMNVLGGLSGTTGFPVAFSMPPEDCIADQGTLGGTLRGMAFMVDKTITVTAIGFIVSVVGVGAISSGVLSGNLWTMNAAGGWAYLADTASQANTPLLSTGVKPIAFSVATTLVPNTVYVMSMTFPTLATTQVMVVAWKGTASLNVQLNLNQGTLWRAGQAAITTRQTAGTIATASITTVTSSPLLFLY